MPLFFPPNHLESASRAAAQTEFPASLVRPSEFRGEWVVLTWGSMQARWDHWGSVPTLARAVAYCDGKFPRGGSPVRLVRVTRDGKMTRVVDPFAPEFDDDDGCPKSDPDCLAKNGDCHDACESAPLASVGN